MRGSTESAVGPAATEAAGEPETAGDAAERAGGAEEYAGVAEVHAGDAGEYAGDARRARWVAVGTGALLTCAGLAAALLRSAGAAPALVPAAYALGAAVCASAAVLGAKGRTRRALWSLIAGTMIMALGDQFD
ncbi:hypothetical protein QWJ26_19980 [Streptomyces sp. CSDS2]|uniref:hypothetical protein n=1 Tax=Streptomyces sp. CSDS2 TaxID=3055051 RepID=UPI0025B04695|nr:hypothetical protein [Streptomyces sp. CSDS2]MDN3262048.1 hypothetical protein [Streptomyces sp. CSDS2]